MNNGLYEKVKKFFSDPSVPRRASYLQKKLRIGYIKACNLLEQFNKESSDEK